MTDVIELALIRQRLARAEAMLATAQKQLAAVIDILERRGIHAEGSGAVRSPSR